MFWFTVLQGRKFGGDDPHCETRLSPFRRGKVQGNGSLDRGGIWGRIPFGSTPFDQRFGPIGVGLCRSAALEGSKERWPASIRCDQALEKCWFQAGYWVQN